MCQNQCQHTCGNPKHRVFGVPTHLGAPKQQGVLPHPVPNYSKMLDPSQNGPDPRRFHAGDGPRGGCRAPASPQLRAFGDKASPRNRSHTFLLTSKTASLGKFLHFTF